MIRQFLLNRKAQKIQKTMIELDIQRISITPDSCMVWFSDSKDLEDTTSMELQAFASGTQTKKALHKLFGNYTPGALYQR